MIKALIWDLSCEKTDDIYIDLLLVTQYPLVLINNRITIKKILIKY